MATAAKQKIEIDPILGPFRLSYLQVFKPVFNAMKKKEMFSATLLLPKKPTPQCPDPGAIYAKIQEISKALADEKFGAEKMAQEGFRAKVKKVLKDGDVEISDSTGEPRFPGYYYMRCDANVEYPPVLVDGAKQPVTRGWKSGDWGRVITRFYAYETKDPDTGAVQNRGINCGFSGIQFLYKDEAMGGVYDPDSVADKFGTVDDAHVTPAYDGGGSNDEFVPPSDDDNPYG